MSCREKEGLLVHVTFSMQVQPQSVSMLTTQGATDNIGANVTEFSLDRPQRSWPMQLEGLGFRFSGYRNFRQLAAKREMAGFREPHFGGIQNFTGKM